MQTVKLNSGVKMPIFGFGVYQVFDEEATQAVTDAIKNSEIDRKEFFLVTKIWITNAGEEKAYKSILGSLEKLQTDYVDLLLIYQPYGDYQRTYRTMEKAYQEEKARTISVNNFYPDRFVDLTNFVEIKPAINQVETHVFQQQKEARKYLDKYNTHIMAWGPFAEGRNNMLRNETLVAIGERYGKSSAQVALRFLTQEGVIVIPKSVKKERMEQNFNIFDFELTEEELQQIRLDLGHSLFLSHHDQKTVEMIINLVR